MFRSYHFLEDDRHLLLVDYISCGLHVCFRVVVIDRCVDTLDGVFEHLQHGFPVVEVRNHVGGIDSCKGLVVAVLQQAAGTYGDGAAGGVDEGFAVGNQSVGKCGFTEGLEDGGVGDVRKCQGIQGVTVHELFEDVGAEHHGFGNHHRGILPFVKFGVVLHHAVNEGQSAAFASEAAVSDACKVGITVETVAAEDCHHALVLHSAVADDGLKNHLPVVVEVLKIVDAELFDEFCGGKQRTAVEPAADVVAADMVEETL